MNYIVVENEKGEIEFSAKDKPRIDINKILINHGFSKLEVDIDDNREIYSAILSNNRNGILIDFLIDVIERDVRDKLKNNDDIKKSNLPLDIIVKFYSAGLLNIGISWLTHKEKYNKEELLSYINELIPETL